MLLSFLVLKLMGSLKQDISATKIHERISLVSLPSFIYCFFVMLFLTVGNSI